MTTETKPSEVLQSISDVLLGAPEVWGQKHYAQDELGNSVKRDDPSAVRWCLLGLIETADPNLAWRCTNFVGRVVGHYRASWNDAKKRTAAEVQAAFQQAADIARSEGQ